MKNFKKFDLFFYQWLLVLALFAMVCTGCGTSKLVSKTTEISRDTTIKNTKDSSALIKNTKVSERYVQPKAVTDSATISLDDLAALKKVVTVDHPMIVEDSTAQVQAKYWFDAYNNLRFKFTSKPAPIKVVDSVTTTSAVKAINTDSKNVQIEYRDKVVEKTVSTLSLKAILWVMGLTAIAVFILMITPIGRMIKVLLSTLTKFFTKSKPS